MSHTPATCATCATSCGCRCLLIAPQSFLGKDAKYPASFTLCERREEGLQYVQHMLATEMSS